MMKVYYIGLLLLFLGSSTGSYLDWNTKWQRLCPALYPRVFTGYTPKGNLTGGIFTQKSHLIEMKQCVVACCNQPTCHVAMMFNNTCYHVQCVNTNLCMPHYRPDLVNISPPSLVLVKPVKDDENWDDFLDTVNEMPRYLTINLKKFSFIFYLKFDVNLELLLKYLFYLLKIIYLKYVKINLQ